VPFDFRALKPIQAKPGRRIFTYGFTQRLCRLDPTKPLLLRWKDLCDMFGGELTVKDLQKGVPQTT